MLGHPRHQRGPTMRGPEHFKIQRRTRISTCTPQPPTLPIEQTTVPTWPKSLPLRPHHAPQTEMQVLAPH
eukprot:4299238-Ditylum_brightwellii.AAC.1